MDIGPWTLSQESKKAVLICVQLGQQSDSFWELFLQYSCNIVQNDGTRTTFNFDVILLENHVFWLFSGPADPRLRLMAWTHQSGRESSELYFSSRLFFPSSAPPDQPVSRHLGAGQAETGYGRLHCRTVTSDPRPRCSATWIYACATSWRAWCMAFRGRSSGQLERGNNGEPRRVDRVGCSDSNTRIRGLDMDLPSII
jgi:hypothetical protein